MLAVGVANIFYFKNCIHFQDYLSFAKSVALTEKVSDTCVPFNDTCVFKRLSNTPDGSLLLCWNESRSLSPLSVAKTCAAVAGSERVIAMPILAVPGLFSVMWRTMSLASALISPPEIIERFFVFSFPMQTIETGAFFANSLGKMP